MNLTTFLHTVIIFALFATGTAMQQASAQNKPPEDSLRSAGLLRPNDLVKENPRWNTASVDLFTNWLSTNLYGYYGPQPKILLDGIPVDINYFGWQNLNMLPLLTDAVENVESRLEPQIYNNTLAVNGLIDFKTASPDSGFNARGGFYIGNESGDPGPLVFDSLRTTPNIDRWGPDGSILLSYRKNNWYTKGVFSIRNHQQTDLISNQRIQLTASVLGTNDEFVNYDVITTPISGLLETGYETKKWSLQSRGIFAENIDYLFLQPFGREIPVQTRFSQFAIQGDYKIGNWLLKGQHVTQNKTIGKRFELHTFIFDWEQSSHTSSTSARYGTPRFSVKPGVIYERLKTEAPGISQPFNDLATFFLDIRAGFEPDVALKVHANTDYDEEQFAHSIKASLPISVTKTWKITPGYFYTEVQPLRQNSFPYWLTRGYTFDDELGITVSQPLESFRNKTTGFNFSSNFHFSDNFSISLGQQYTRHQDLNIPWQMVEENEFLDTLPGTFTATREHGERLSLSAEVDNSVADWLQHRVHFQLQRTLAGTQRYRDYFMQIPETKITYQLNLNPVSNLILSLNTTYRSSTEWREYEALDGVEYLLPSGIPIRRFSGIFRTRTPAFTNVTLSTKKWFWERRISTQFSVENLLNEEVRTHTLGAELFTKFDVKLGLNF